MNKSKRPIPFRWGTDDWRTEYRRLLDAGMIPKLARQRIRTANALARAKIGINEKCEARTRVGGSCQAPARVCGRCRIHGGASTGPTSIAGIVQGLVNLRMRWAKK